MKKTIGTTEAAMILIDDDNACWSRLGAFALVEHLERLEEELGEEVELDVVVIRCEYSEYESAFDAFKQYGYDEDYEDELKGMEEEEKEELALKYLKDRTTVIKFNGGVIVQDF